MSKLIVNSFSEFEAYVGKELGVSEYFKITQDRINKFAEATLDYQWIHVDEEKAKVESPFKSTIAHGYLVVSLLPYLWDQIIEVNNISMLINYGLEKLKFNQAVLAGGEVRLRVNLVSLVNLRGIAKADLKIVLEIKNSPKNALEATAIFLYHFNK